METYRETIARIARTVQAQDFDRPFRVYPLGSVGEADPDTYAPEVFHSETDDVEVSPTTWEPLTGLTGQYGYNGAVMHSSEYVGEGIAMELWEAAQEAGHGVTFVMTAVNVRPEDDEEDPEPAGWAILRLSE